MNWRKEALRWLPGVLLSALAVLALLQFASFQELGSALSAVHPGWLVFTAAVFLVSLLARGLAWWTILQRKVSLGRATMTLTQGYLLSNLFPFRLGELGRAILLNRLAGLSAYFVLSTIVIERLFDLALAAGLLLATLPLVFGADWARPAALISLGIVLVGLVGLYLLARNRQRWLPGIGRWLNRWPRLAERLLPRLDAVLDGLGALTDLRQFSAALAWMLVSWALAVVEYFVLLKVMIPQAEWWWGLFVLGAAAAGVAVPSAPSAVGIYEGAIVGALVLLGAGAGGAALAYAVLLHLTHFALTCTIGFIGLAVDGFSLGKLYGEARGFQK